MCGHHRNSTISKKVTWNSIKFACDDIHYLVFNGELMAAAESPQD